MIRCALLILRKDVGIVLSRGGGLPQALLLGLLLIFLFSLSLDAGDVLSSQAAAAMFWLASAFCQVLVFHMLYALEETNLARLGLAMLPGPIQGVWLGKMLAGLCLILISQLLFVPAVFVFLGQSAGSSWPVALAGLVAVNVGMAACGSLLGALSVGQSGRESLLSIILFPLLIPLLLAGVRLVASGIVPVAGLAPAAPDDTARWFGIALAFDALFVAAGLILFPYMYTGED